MPKTVSGQAVPFQPAAAATFNTRLKVFSCTGTEAPNVRMCMPIHICRAFLHMTGAVSELEKLRVRSHDPDSLRPEVDQGGASWIYLDDTSEPVLVVRDLVVEHEVLDGRRSGRGAEGAGGKVPPRGGFGRTHDCSMRPTWPCRKFSGA